MSDWQQSANKRRDARQSKHEDSAVKGTAKKDTRKWCGGKPGREHKPECFAMLDFGGKPSTRARTLACIVCGKHLKYYWGYGKQEKPEWVDK
jgi:hypothetical protein